MTEPFSLPPSEQRLYDLLAGKGDVAIQTLVDGLGGEPNGNPQQWLGPYVTRLNRRLKNLKMKVKPGEARGTYVLVIT